MAADVIYKNILISSDPSNLCIRVSWPGKEKNVPSSRTSIIASEGGGVHSSTLEDWPARRREERVEDDIRGSVATVRFDICVLVLWAREGGVKKAWFQLRFLRFEVGDTRLAAWWGGKQRLTSRQFHIRSHNIPRKVPGTYLLL